MKLLRDTTRNIGIAGELVAFVWNRHWWLLPLIITLVLLGAFIVLAQSSAVAPFIYTLF